MIRPTPCAALLTVLLAAAPGPAAACALALVFALDVSASVDPGEYREQRDGLADALLDPAVTAAILAQPGGVALAAYEWSGRYQQDMMLDWHIVTEPAGLFAAAGTIAAHERRYAEFPTAIGYALGHGSILLRDGPVCGRQVIDISGDGIGNEGFSPTIAYREFDFDTITVNGLVISDEQEVIRYYEQKIPHGPGAFVEIALDFGDYRDAMRRKLLRELEGPQMVSLP